MQKQMRVQNKNIVELACILLDWLGLRLSGLYWDGMEFDAE